MSKNLTFKLVMEADTKSFDAGTKASKDNWDSFISLLKKEADGLKAASLETSKEVGKIVPDDLQKKADQAKGKLGEVAQAANALETQASQASGKIDGLGNELQDTANKANKAGFEIGGAIPGDAVQLAEMLGNKFFSAAKEIESLGDKSTISAGELRAMSSAGEQGLNELNLALKAAQAELVRLQSTDGTMKDIEIAKQRVLSIQDAIREASSAFDYYQGVAVNAMKGVDNATQAAINKVQQFSSVDLTGVVGAAQTATRAIESMGDGASLSTKEIERIGSIGTNSINALERELLTARNAFSALEKSSEAVTLNEIKAAGDKVKGLEQAVDLTKSAFSEFNVKATTAMQSVSTSTDKASGSAKQAGHAIYDALGIKPPSVVNDAIADLTRKLEHFKANSKLPAEEVARVTQATEKEIARLKNELSGIEPAAQKANSGVSALSKGMDGAKFAVNALVGAMAALGVGLGVRELAEAADSYTNLSARIKIATAEHGNFEQAMAGVHQVALATNSNLEATAGLFTKVNDVGKQMGMTQQQSLDLVKTINMAIQTGGGSAQASEAAITQFTQALQSGVLRGDEFNSIMEQAPGISKALAASLGVTTGELRKMAENGELSTEKVIKALQGQSAAIQAEYDQFPTTIGNALTKIATQWQILIGTMDQANGASATVADWLVMIADNMDVVETLLEDIGKGFVWVGDQLKKIDPATIEALKEALSTAYETIKSMASSFGNGIGIAVDQLNTLLGAIFNFESGVDTATDKTNGFTKALQSLNVVFGFIGDGFDAISIVANLLAGVFYDVAAAWINFKSKFTWGDTKQQLISEMNEMAQKAQDWYNKASNGATDFKSKGIAAIEEISKTQEQKNQETLKSNNATFAELIKQNEDFNQKSKELADERASLEAQLNQARKDGNQSTIDEIIQKSNELEAREKEHAANKTALDKDMLASAQDYAEAAIKANGGVMDGVMQADLLTKGYIVTIDEAGKVSVKAGESAAQAAEKAKEKEEALKLAKENVKKADEELLAYQKQAAIERVLLDKQIEEAKRTGDLNALASAQSSINAINAKEAELANNRDLRVAELNKANTGSGQIAETAYSRASAAAKLFGVDLDVSLNKVSKSFNSSGNDLNDLKIRLEEAGVTGKQAGNVLYKAWEEWLNKAKSQAEIDMANAKMVEFEKQGVFSTKQVEMGILAIKRANADLPDDLDETSAAFERLGIKTKEQLKLAAQQAVMDYNTIKNSGQATAEGIQQAHEKAAQAVALAGDTGVTAQFNAMDATQKLRVEVDETGKSVVKTAKDWEDANARVASSVGQIGNAYQNVGDIVRDEANAAQVEWNKVAQAAQDAWNADMKRQGKGLSAAISGYQSMSKNDVISQIKSMGYSEDQAKKLAGSIWSQGLSADRDAKFAAYGKGGNLAMNKLIEQEFNNAAAKGLTTQHGTNKINELLRNLDVRSTGSTPKVNDYVPNISEPKIRDLQNDAPTKNVRFEFVSGGKRFEMQGSQEDGDTMESILREFEMLKKAM